MDEVTKKLQNYECDGQLSIYDYLNDLATSDKDNKEVSKDGV